MIKANQMVSHRGPDDEGYLLWGSNNELQVFAGSDTALQTKSVHQYPIIPDDTKDWRVGLGHRRLSIIDLSPAGHQPMVLQQAGLSITYNGEIYNYLELKGELRSLGCVFHTHSDTEVILQAWATWGEQAMHRFNGMFAFLLLDTRKQKMYAVRDRFGVKPLYYTQTSGYIAFASEVKQLRTLPAYRFKLDEQIAYDYLRYGLIDHAAQTFDVGIDQVMPGTMVAVDISTGDFKTSVWYTLQPKTWKGTEHEACDRFYELLKDSVKLRMRSDVPVGSALSGGLDSSTIVCLMREVLTDQGAGDHLIKTITSCQEDKKYDEWEYANMVINQVKADPYKVFPSFEKLLNDLEKMMWHMDYPFGSTSQFSQWCVFEEAKKQGLSVMIDGQGADEQLAGYGGNDLALYAGLFNQLRWVELIREASAYKKSKGNWPIGFLLGVLQQHMPYGWFKFSTKKYADKGESLQWLTFKTEEINKPYYPRNLQAGLIQQVSMQPLPSLLRYEDRNSMAFSVESRVPFMDYRLIEFTLGLPEKFIYRRGERKYILRQSLRGVVPEEILERKDKMGFVSPEERWIKEEGKEWFNRAMDNAPVAIERFVNKAEFDRLLVDMQTGRRSFDFSVWRTICLNYYLKKHNHVS